MSASRQKGSQTGRVGARSRRCDRGYDCNGVRARPPRLEEEKEKPRYYVGGKDVDRFGHLWGSATKESKESTFRKKEGETEKNPVQKVEKATKNSQTKRGQGPQLV